MISVEEARERIMAHVQCMATERLPVEACMHRFVVEPVMAPFDHPLFDNSAVDGYAFAFGTADRWTVVGEVAAGQVRNIALGPGECVRIFTGAALPEGTDTVVMQEFTVRQGDILQHTDAKLRRGGNVRWKGEQVKAGDVLLQAGALFTPQVAGLLASSGVSHVITGMRPQVDVLVTGSEFAAPGSVPGPGRIFSSNDAMLGAALELAKVNWHGRLVPDDRQMLEQALRESEAEVIITTGGVSVGDHDLVREVLEGLGATIVMHGVRQKPGKPMLFALLNGVPVFGLPGNPRAVMILYWEYVLPFLRGLMGAAQPHLEKESIRLKEGVTLKGDRSEFRAGRVSQGEVMLLRDEGSHMLSSLVEANALVYLPAGTHRFPADSPVEVHYLPTR